MKIALRILGVLVVVAVVIGVIAWRLSRPPDVPDFYATPKDLPSASGVVVRAEPFPDPSKVPDGAEAHLFMYTTTVEGGDQRVATATVLVPTAPHDGPRPLVAWAHGTTGVERGCAPSLMKQPWAGIPALDRLIAEGYAVVATDYVGLGTETPHQYLVGRSAAYNVLDAIRAVHALDERDDVTEGDGLTDEVVVWGHSQGGQTTLFTGQVAEEYAPEVDLIGLGPISPPTDLEALLEKEQSTLVGKVLSSLAVVSWSEVFPEVSFDETVRPAARPLVRGIAEQCLSLPAGLVTLVEGELLRSSIFAKEPSELPAVVEVMQENSPDQVIDLPVFLAQGLADDVVDPTVTEAYIDARCAQGQTMDAWLVPGQSHLSIVDAKTPIAAPLMAWTEARFAGEPAEEGCQRNG